MYIRERANDLFANATRYNCCQAVVCAYCEFYGIEDTDVFKLAEGFGAGMGALRDTCGAVTGLFMAISLHNSVGDKENPRATKMDTYGAVREYAQKFKDECGSIYCRDLKSTEGGRQVVTCQQCVDVAARLVEEFIESRK